MSFRSPRAEAAAVNHLEAWDVPTEPLTIITPATLTPAVTV
ncbi:MULTISPECIES: hypothetical protein [Microbacterium]|jgi:hypothetical protein|nr:hypothetical protein [Microbacterium testaceum]